MADTVKQYAVIRCFKQQLHDLVRVENHNLRFATTPVENIDPERSHMNRYMVGGGAVPLTELVRKRIAASGYKRKIRPDQVHALEFMMTASPEFFDADMRAGQSPKLEAWIADSMAFIEDHVGKENIVQVVLHMDESSPHLHVVAVPISIDDDAKVSMSSKPWTAAGKWKRMWTDYARAMKAHGLVRGEFNSPDEHTSLKAGRKDVLDRVANAEANATQAVATADAAKKSVDDTINRMDYQLAKHTAQQQRQDKKIDTVLEQQQEVIAKQAELIQQQTTVIQSLRDKLTEAYDTIKRLLGRSGSAGPRQGPYQSNGTPVTQQPFNPQTPDQTIKDLLGDSFDM